MIVVWLLSVFVIVSSQRYDRDSAQCQVLKNMYDAMCPDPEMTTFPTTTTHGTSPTTTTSNGSTVPTTTLQTGSCFVRYTDKCFWIESGPGKYITFDEGKRLCEAKGGNPANIYSKTHYDRVWRKMKELAGHEDDHAYYVWLGMRYDSQPRTKAVQYDGTPAPYTRWHRGYPTSTYGSSQITLVAKTSLTTRQHMHCWKDPSGRGGRKGILCEK